jgi:hypothetical protein
MDKGAMGGFNMNFCHVNQNGGLNIGACLGLVQSKCIQNAFKKTLGPLDQEPDQWSGSPQGMNLGLNHGQVWLGSGSNQGSEPNLTIPTNTWEKWKDQRCHSTFS